MNKENITKGEWIVSKEDPKSVLTDMGGYRPNSMHVVSSSIDELKANAQLIAEAGTVFNECGLTPRDLLDIHKKVYDLFSQWLYLESSKQESGETDHYLKCMPDLVRKGLKLFDKIEGIN